MTNPTALTAGTFLKGEGFDRAFPLNTVQAYAAEYREDPQAAFDRAVGHGHETAWCVNGGTSITNQPMAIKLAKQAKEDADFAAAITVKTGEVYLIEGVPQVCKVNGDRFSDAIVFRPL